MQFILLFHEHEHDWRQMLLFAVGLVFFVALINSLAGGVLKRLNRAGQSKGPKKQKHKRAR
jgi:hypothetical protein